MLSRFARDESGTYLVVSALTMPILLGVAGLGTEAAMWLHDQRALQGAVDGAALTAATAYYQHGAQAGVVTEAESVLSMRGLTAQAQGVTIAINRPPLSGAYTASMSAVEVIVSQSKPRLLSALWTQQPMQVSARAVARGTGGRGCVLALSPSASGAIQAGGSTSVTLLGCSIIANSSHASALQGNGSAMVAAQSASVVGGVSGAQNFNTVDGIHTNQQAASDPYADVQPPSFSGCDHNNYSTNTVATLNPGVYCNGIRVNASANVNLNPGIYYMDRGSFTVNGNATVTGHGVTLVFTSRNGANYATAAINGGATVNLTAPTDGPTAGIVLFGDRTMPTGTTFRLNGGASQSFNGAVYVPKGHLDFAGTNGSQQGCTQLIADTINFTGTSDVRLDCSGSGTRPIASAVASLVE
jgi:hypothetical protein